MNRKHLEHACEEVDASVFSGDTLFDDEDRKELSKYIERWTRAISIHERSADDSKADDSQVQGHGSQARNGDRDTGTERPVADPQENPVKESTQIKGVKVGGLNPTWHDNYIRHVENDHWQCYDEVGQPLGVPHMWYIDAVEALEAYALTLEPGKLGPAPVHTLPRSQQVKRFGDMDPDAYLRMTREDDGDIIVEVLTKDWHGDMEHSNVQFCTRGGGGQSSHTLKALAALMVAIEKDNEENKQQRS